MNDITNVKQPEYYEIIPEFNSAGRLCNHGSGNNAPVKVPASEWERFNSLAGRQHEIIDGIVIFNENLEPCLPDDVQTGATVESLQQELIAQGQYITDLELIILGGGIDV